MPRNELAETVKRMQRDLKKVGDVAMANELRQNIRAAVQPVADAIADEARAINQDNTARLTRVVARSGAKKYKVDEFGAAIRVGSKRHYGARFIETGTRERMNRGRIIKDPFITRGVEASRTLVVLKLDNVISKAIQYHNRKVAGRSYTSSRTGATKTVSRI